MPDVIAVVEGGRGVHNEYCPDEAIVRAPKPHTHTHTHTHRMVVGGGGVWFGGFGLARRVKQGVSKTVYTIHDI